MAPVGKSGAFIYALILNGYIIIFDIAIVASTTSVRLCGGIFVAIPTAIPDVPLINKFGILFGKTVGSFKYHQSSIEDQQYLYLYPLKDLQIFLHSSFSISHCCRTISIN